MERANDILPLASSFGGKLFHVVRSSFVDSLEACLKSYHSRLTQVQIVFCYMYKWLVLPTYKLIKGQYQLVTIMGKEPLTVLSNYH